MICAALRRLFRRPPPPKFCVGDMVFYAGRAMAISRMSGADAELVWLDEQQQLRTAGYVPLVKLRSTAP